MVSVIVLTKIVIAISRTVASGCVGDTGNEHGSYYLGLTFESHSNCNSNSQKRW